MAAEAGDASLQACFRMAALRAGVKALPAAGNADIWARNLPAQNVCASGNCSQIKSIMTAI